MADATQDAVADASECAAYFQLTVSAGFNVDITGALEETRYREACTIDVYKRRRDSPAENIAGMDTQGTRPRKDESRVIDACCDIQIEVD